MLVLAATLVAAPLTAQQGKAKPNPRTASARISEDSARAIALAQVPGGRVIEAELEKEHGKLIWSFDVKVVGKSGVEEVQIDATSGALVSHEHESPKAEAKERAAELAKKRPPSPR
ncbi:MAG: PepSY domain-containing protein [Gemmatimonadaceae bacterium]